MYHLPTLELFRIKASGNNTFTDPKCRIIKLCPHACKIHIDQRHTGVNRAESFLPYNYPNGWLDTLLIRLKNKYKCEPHLDFGLVNLLRDLSQFDSGIVLDFMWRVSDVETMPYRPAHSSGCELCDLFPERREEIEASDSNDYNRFVHVPGERLMERSALVHQFEFGMFVRLRAAESSADLISDYRLWRGPAAYQATNTDLEIRCAEASSYDIITADDDLITFLQSVYCETAIFR